MVVNWPMLLFVVSIVGAFFVAMGVSLTALALDQDPLPDRLKGFAAFWGRFLLGLLLYILIVGFLGFHFDLFGIPDA